MNKIYKCAVCGKIIEVLHDGGGELVCCGKPMELLSEKTKDQGKEKHVPVVRKEGNKVSISVGKIPHPMEENHYIEWIEVITENGSLRKFLKPGKESVARFEKDEEIITARSYCNVHGLWKNTK